MPETVAYDGSIDPSAQEIWTDWKEMAKNYVIEWASGYGPDRETIVN